MPDDTIAVLPPQVANQIAAGEVIERPASVVKELLENALDARATRVELLITQGGRALIELADNGTGMTRQNAQTAFERQATSKLRGIHDLQELSTLGFRGEALPSIASVARVTLSTSGCEAEPLVEWDSIATTGSAPVSWVKDWAELLAMAANSSALGFCTSPESANRNTPSWP